jgi:hypothetical protein
MSVMDRTKCLAIWYLFTTRITRSPIVAAPCSPASPPASSARHHGRDIRKLLLGSLEHVFALAGAR